ncbi:MAG: amino acid ABC transporter permease [Pseudomonadota bacterium]
MSRQAAPATGSWASDLWGTPWRAALSAALGAGMLWLGWQLAEWAVWDAVFHADADLCRRPGQGACWGVVAEKARPILWGRFPYEAQWRSALSTVILLVLLGASAWPGFWRRSLVLAWAVGWIAFAVLMHGGVAGLSVVDTGRWGGLTLTLMLACLALSLALPLGVALALGRRSHWPVVRTVCTTYIELVRGVPLISVLFMATFMLPLVLPQGWRPDVLLRVLVGLVMFAAAYLAEVVRGGLQSVPRGQVEAAQALGLGPWQVQATVVLPQALRAVVPSLMNSVIGTLKDSSLVTVVGLYELTGALSLALGGDPVWRPFYLEGYLFISAVYFTLCFSLSRYSRWVEARVASPL